MSESPQNDTVEPRSARLWEALLPVVLLVVFLSYYIIKLKGDNPHLPLIGGTIIAGAMALRLGYKWEDIQKGVIGGIMISMQAIIILMLIGMLISTWIASGIVPTMIYYGLELISPTTSFLRHVLSARLFHSPPAALGQRPAPSGLHLSGSVKGWVYLWR